MKRLVAYLILTCLAACREQAKTEGVRQAVPAQPETPLAVNQADSARAFVQRFYDWYLATEARKGSPYDSLLAGRRTLLTDSLARAFRADIAAQRAGTVAEIGSLSAEADIFLNSQDPCPHYIAQPPRKTGAGTFAVLVVGDCASPGARPNLEVHVGPGAAGWQIQNIKDPTNRSFDLLGALVRYHATEVSPGTSSPSPRDSSRGGTS